MHKKIMLQGTGSSVGKSVLTAGLCRVFSQDGYKVAPFKSQNMALNSFVDEDGKEMSRAQVIQAEGANTTPKAFMNPILLKPTGDDNSSQVILEGIPFKNMQAKEYYENFELFKKIVTRNYNILKENFEIGVIEGAGSPAEINFRKNDIVNMGMAEIADSNVILIADIERGGVFASIYGTLMILDKPDRDRIKGYIINKFRGDRALLDEGIKLLDEELTKQNLKVPCLGVLPYIDLKLENEDSYNFSPKDEKSKKDLNIAVINFEKLSNSTDFTSLLVYEDVNLVYISSKEQLTGDFDLIILPGSKNAIYDYTLIEARKITQGVLEYINKGTLVLGIHSGFQMLGKSIKDLKQVESSFLKAETLGVLNMSTNMKEKKYTKQVTKTLTNCTGFLEGFDGITVSGCEIHQGLTTGEDSKYSVTGEDDFALICKDNIIGTYIHGLFNSSKFTRKFLNKLRERKGLPPILDYVNMDTYQETELKKLAKLMKTNLDMKKIYKILK